MEPAALMTMSSSPISSFSAPKISVWAGSSWSCGAKQGSTSSSHCARSSRARSPCSAGACQPSSPACSAPRPSRASATSMVAACFAASKALTLRFTKRTSGLRKAVWEAVVKSV